MIYLDCAATSMQKPAAVYDAVQQAMRTMASPGRGAYASAMKAAETAYLCRLELAQLFRVSEPERVVFTFNATHGLNIAIHDLVSAGDKVVVSGYEHNSVMRPLYQIGAEVHVVRSPLFDDDTLLALFDEQLRGAKAAVCTAMSNVFGYKLPVYEIAALCKQRGVPLVVDASQLAGCGALDFGKLGAVYMAMPGHKGLLGPQGTGVLICGQVPKPFMSGGSGSESLRMTMPDVLPDRLEAGTHNVPGIAGLLEGVRAVRKMKPERIGLRERRFMERFVDEIAGIEGMETFYTPNESKQGAVLSLRHEAIDSQILTETLGNAGIAVRGGFHCAPAAHETAGTLESGTVRFSFSPFLSDAEIKKAARALKTCVNKLKT